MESRSDGLEAFTRRRSGVTPCPRAVSLCSAFCPPVVLEELEFNEFRVLPSDFSLSMAALVIKAFFRSSLAVLDGAAELDDFPPVLTTVLLRCSSALAPMSSLVAAGLSALFGSLS